MTKRSRYAQQAQQAQQAHQARQARHPGQVLYGLALLKAGKLRANVHDIKSPATKQPSFSRAPLIG
jgi:hypothetical protein